MIGRYCGVIGLLRSKYNHYNYICQYSDQQSQAAFGGRWTNLVNKFRRNIYRTKIIGLVSLSDDVRFLYVSSKFTINVGYKYLSVVIPIPIPISSPKATPIPMGFPWELNSHGNSHSHAHL